MIEQPYKNYGMIFFENRVPYEFCSEIIDVIEQMDVKREDWFFIILFKNDDICFNNILGEYRNVQGNETVPCNTPPNITSNFVVPQKRLKKNIPFIRHPKKLLNNEKFCLEEKIHFFWHFIHELQHLSQAEEFGTQFATLNNFLMQSFPDKDQMFFPPEYDAERIAKQMVIDKFKQSKFLKYMEFRKKNKGENEQYLENINRIDIGQHFNVEEETQKLIRKEKISLKEKLKEFHKQNIFLSLDIDAICEEKN